METKILQSTIKKNSGFALVEVMVASGLLVMVLMGFAESRKQISQASSYSQSITQEKSYERKLSLALQNPTACQNSFMGITLGSGVPLIKDSAGNVLAKTGVETEKGIKIESIKLKDNNIVAQDGMRSVDLVIKTYRTKKNTESKYGQFVIPLRVMAVSSTAAITKCYSDTEQLAQTAVIEACTSVGGIMNPSGQCDLVLYVKRSGSTMSGPLVSSSSVSALSLSATNATISNINTSKICIGVNCRTTFANQYCAAGQVSTGQNADGSMRCLSLNCPAGKFFQSIDTTTGLPVCVDFPNKTCPAGQFISQVSPLGVATCSAVPNTPSICPAGKAMNAIDASGNPTCISIPTWGCPAGTLMRGFTALGPDCVAVTSLAGKMCPANTFWQGVDGGGNPVCKSATATGNCFEIKIGSSSDDCDNWWNRGCGGDYFPRGCAFHTTKAKLFCCRTQINIP